MTPKEKDLASKLYNILKKQQPEWTITGNSIVGSYKGKIARATNQTRILRESIAWRR